MIIKFSYLLLILINKVTIHILNSKSNCLKFIVLSFFAELSTALRDFIHQKTDSALRLQSEDLLSQLKSGAVEAEKIADFWQKQHEIKEVLD